MVDVEIRELVAQYLQGDLPAEELEDRLETEVWDLDGPASDLAATVLRLLSELGYGDWTESELKERLGVVTRTYWLEQAPRVARTSAMSTVTTQDQRSATADRWLAAGSV